MWNSIPYISNKGNILLYRHIKKKLILSYVFRPVESLCDFLIFWILFVFSGLSRVSGFGRRKWMDIRFEFYRSKYMN